MAYRLILNPGSTSTKLAVYDGREQLFAKSIQHRQEEIEKFDSVVAQKDFRMRAISDFIGEKGIDKKDIEGIISIGGLIRPGVAGVYRVNWDMVDDLREAKYNEHASNVGAIIAWEMARELNVEAYIADAITADEMQKVARISGLPEIVRLGRSHTLNQKAMAARAAAELGKKYDRANLVVAHLGGGISVTAHSGGRMVDTNSARGEGPFCIDRTGGLNSYELVKLCFSGKYCKDEMLAKISGNGGLVSYLGTRDFREVEKRIGECDELAHDVFDAMAYQIAKEIAAMAAALNGLVDAIVLTGGMANSKAFVSAIGEQVKFLGPVIVYPGENEMGALAQYLDEVLSGKRKAREYKSGGNA